MVEIFAVFVASKPLSNECLSNGYPLVTANENGDNVCQMLSTWIYEVYETCTKIRALLYFSESWASHNSLIGIIFKTVIIIIIIIIIIIRHNRYHHLYQQLKYFSLSFIGT
jgi:hypothetical protein